MEEKNDFLTSLNCPIPVDGGIGALIGYTTANITRDALEGFIAHVEDAAAKAPESQEG